MYPETLKTVRCIIFIMGFSTWGVRAHTPHRHTHTHTHTHPCWQLVQEKLKAETAGIAEIGQTDKQPHTRTCVIWRGGYSVLVRQTNSHTHTSLPLLLLHLFFTCTAYHYSLLQVVIHITHARTHTHTHTHVYLFASTSTASVLTSPASVFTSLLLQLTTTLYSPG